MMVVPARQLGEAVAPLLWDAGIGLPVRYGFIVREGGQFVREGGIGLPMRYGFLEMTRMAESACCSSCFRSRLV